MRYLESPLHGISEAVEDEEEENERGKLLEDLGRDEASHKFCSIHRIIRLVLNVWIVLDRNPVLLIRALTFPIQYFVNALLAFSLIGAVTLSVGEFVKAFRFVTSHTFQLCDLNAHTDFALNHPGPSKR